MTLFAGAPLASPVVPSDLLRGGLDVHPEGRALVSTFTELSWRELDHRSSGLAAGLLGLGLEPGDRIASLMPNRWALIVHYLACFKAGVVAVPLNYRYTPVEIDHALRVSGARVILAHAERDRDLADSGVAPTLPLPRLRYEDVDDARGGVAFEGLMHEEPRSERLDVPAPSTPAVIFFTSGSTGPPKGVTHTHETIGWMLASSAAGLEFTPDDILLAASSLSHVGAFYVTFGALSVGAGVVVPHSYDGDELLPLLREHEPSVLSMLPSALFALTRDHDASGDDFSSLRLCRAAGDTVSAELEREFTELSGFPIDEAYGLTETGLVTVSPPSGRIAVGSVGRAVPGVSLSVRDEDGVELAPGSEGRLWIRTRAMTVGYWEDPEATQAAVADGWLDSGDVMHVDEEGYFRFRGRRKQIIVHDGSNITPQEIEGCLLEHSAVESAGVIGVHDLVHGENVRAYVTYKPTEPPPTSQELIRFARDRVGYKAPEEIVVLDEMLRTATGKVDRSGLKRLAEAHLER